MRRLKNILHFGRLTAHGATGLVQTETHSGEVATDVRNPQAHGFASKAPIGSEVYTVYQGGNKDNGATLIVAGNSPVALAEGDTVVYNVAGIKMHLNGSKITITGATELTCTGDIVSDTDVADQNATTPSIQDMRDLFDSHTHNETGSVTAVPNQTMN